MKKIVALVLGLVMALSLCTVAFADDATYYGDFVGAAKLTADEKVTLSLEKFTTGDANYKTVDTYKLYATVVATGAKNDATGLIYVLATDEDYDKVFVQGKEITYLSVSLGKYNDTAVKATTVKEADAKCGDLVKLNDNAILYLYGEDEVVMKVGKVGFGARVALVDGKLITLVPATALDYKEIVHKYLWDSEKTNGKTVVTKVYCSICGAEFEFVQGNVTEATKAFGADNFKQIDVVDGKGLFIKTAAVAADPKPAEKTDSPKTFDAGIALYVGMSLMSVAGSAVVIGKKKEF